MRPLTLEIERASGAIFAAHAGSVAQAPRPKSTGHGLISAVAVRDPETARYAFKVTLAVMLCYAAEELLDWPAIHTCVVTCFFVSLGTLGETVHKANLRICGALIGGALGILTILLLMPLMTDLGDLLLALAAVTLLAGWIATGSERISYAGWQIGLAYYMTTLQGYGPTLDMQTARDRVIGIVLGDLIVLLVFRSLWPVSVMDAARREVAAALLSLAGLMRLQRLEPAEAERSRNRLQGEYGAAIGRARTLIASSGYEPAPARQWPGWRLDAGALVAFDRILLDVAVIQNTQGDPAWRSVPAPDRQVVVDYHEALADWFECRARAMLDVGSVAKPEPAVAPPPQPASAVSAAHAAWYDLLDRNLRSLPPFGATRTHG